MPLLGERFLTERRTGTARAESRYGYGAKPIRGLRTVDFLSAENVNQGLARAGFRPGALSIGLMRAQALLQELHKNPSAAGPSCRGPRRVFSINQPIAREGATARLDGLERPAAAGGRPDKRLPHIIGETERRPPCRHAGIGDHLAVHHVEGHVALARLRRAKGNT